MSIINQKYLESLSQKRLDVIKAKLEDLKINKNFRADSNKNVLGSYKFCIFSREVECKKCPFGDELVNRLSSADTCRILKHDQEEHTNHPKKAYFVLRLLEKRVNDLIERRKNGH